MSELYGRLTRLVALTASSGLLLACNRTPEDHRAEIDEARAEADQKTHESINEAEQSANEARQEANEKIAREREEAREEVADERRKLDKTVAEHREGMAERKVDVRRDLETRLADLDKRLVDVRAKIRDRVTAKAQRPEVLRAVTDAQEKSAALRRSIAELGPNQDLGPTETNLVARIDELRKTVDELERGAS